MKTFNKVLLFFFSETFFSIHREDIEVNDDYLNDFIHNSHSLLLQVYINNNNVLLFNTKVRHLFELLKPTPVLI